MIELRKKLVAQDLTQSKINASKHLLPHVRCFTCGNLGHKSFQYPHKKKPPKGRLVWVPKGPKPIGIGPKTTWVSKLTSKPLISMLGFETHPLFAC